MEAMYSNEGGQIHNGKKVDTLHFSKRKKKEKNKIKIKNNPLKGIK